MTKDAPVETVPGANPKEGVDAEVAKNCEGEAIYLQWF
jgi:hypothetical protein